MITCYTCHLSKTDEEFSWKIVDVKRSGVCKDCHKNYRRKHYLDNRQKYIDKARKWENSQGGRRNTRYRLDSDKYEELLNKFNGLCWLCQTNPGFIVDHDHNCCTKPITCGKCIRGILCSKCNVGLGMLGDNLEGLEKAIKYLNSTSLTSIKVM